MITRVKLVTINVTDQDKALAFYTEKLGFTVKTDAPMFEGADSRWLELEPPGGEPRVVLFKHDGGGDEAKPMSNIMFTTDDVQKTYDELKERGVEFTQPPTKQHWGTYAVFADVDGNTFLVSSET